MPKTTGPECYDPLCREHHPETAAASKFAPNREAFAVRLATACVADEATQHVVIAANLLETVQYNIRQGRRDDALLQLGLAKARIEKAMAQLQRP